MAGAAATSVVIGVAIPLGFGPLLVIVALGAVAIACAGRWRRGLSIGLVVLTALNGIPYADMTSLSAGIVPGATDLFVPLLVIALLYWNLEPEAAARSPRLRRLAWAWCGVFVAWWLLIWGASLVQGVPAIVAGLYGRDFLWFAVLLPLTIGALRGRRDVMSLTVTLGVGAVVYAVAQHLSEFGGVSTSSFLHASFVGGTEGQFKRYFSATGHLEAAGVAYGAGLALLGRGARARAVGWALLAIVGAAVVLQFTRAFYAAFIVGFVVLTALWATRRGEAGRRLGHAAGVGAAAVAAAAAIFIFAGASIDRESAPGLVIERANSGVTQVQQNSGTFGQRRAIYDSMLRRLGPNWPVGLGFLDPGVHYVAGIPRGDVRNSDVGLLGAVMTMGAVGLLLLFAPIVAVIVLAVRSASQPLRDHWFAYGAALFLLLDLLSSPTLITLFSVPGLVLTAVMCAALARVLEPSASSGLSRDPA